LAVAISIVLPFIQFEWFTFFSSSEQTIHLYKIIYGGGENEVAVTGNATISREQIALYTLLTTSFLLLVVLCFRIIRIEFLKKKYPVQQFDDFNFINTDISSAPFSFLKNIFWRNDISLEEETGKQILQHEITHIRQKHSLDKLFMQLILCFYWMNPFFHLIKKELFLIHEFIADEEAVKHADADAFAKMLLTAQFGKFNFLPAQSIFYSSIKRRLTMLTTSKKSQFSYAGRLMVLPLIASLVCLFAFTVKTRNSSNKIAPVATEKPFLLVVDAGHGGKDLGAAANGLYEKDATLKLAQKIKGLSSQYNLDVILTRNTDIYMNVQEKSNFANAQNADAFITLHTNAQPHKKTDSSGIEIYIPKQTAQTPASTVLGSAILQSLQPNFKTPGALNVRNAGVWVLNNTTIPSALIECGYITNKDDANNLKDDAKVELMARNILEGIAMYANNAIDKSNLYQLKNESEKDTTPSSALIIRGNAKPLYVLDGKVVSEAEIKGLDGSTIKTINVLKDKNATDKYGDKGKTGVVEMISRKESNKSTVPVNALFVINGQVVSKKEADKIDPDQLSSINVLKDKSATDKYGDKGKDGVVEITLKKSDKATSLPNNVLYVLDGKIISEAEMKEIDEKSIESINVLKDKNATDKYGDKGKNGVVEINLKSNANSTSPVIVKDVILIGDKPANPLYISDGKIISEANFKKINPASIDRVDILKDKMATGKYGEKGKNGVVEITLVKTNPSIVIKNVQLSSEKK